MRRVSRIIAKDTVAELPQTTFSDAARDVAVVGGVHKAELANR